MASVARPPEGLVDVVKHAISNHQHERSADKAALDRHPSTPPLARPPVDTPAVNRSHREEIKDDSPWKDNEDGKDNVKKSYEKLPEQPARDRPEDTSPASPVSKRSFPVSSSRNSTVQRTPAPGTPQQRSGPPRSISYSYSISSAAGHGFPAASKREGSSRQNSQFEDEDPDRVNDFPPAMSPFRGALDYEEREQRERRHKRRDSYFQDASWNPMKWITESPRQTPRDEEPSPRPPHRTYTEGGHRDEDSEDEQAAAGPSGATPPQSPTSPRLRHARSMPHMKNEARTPQTPKWGRLRSLLPHIAGQAKAQHSSARSVAPATVNITDELITGGLATLMLRFWIERDEKGHRRVPALFHRLKIRVTDSLHPMHGHKAVFRIECEYAEGAVRWVVYRQLREFISLHGHYAVSKAYNRNIDALPDFPKTTLPYFRFLKERGSDVGKADFARLQRETLENYLICLIRAVMFHPAVNRLAGFLEFGALTVALAQSGGTQYKAGLLRLEGVAPKPSFGRRAAGWREKQKQRWCCVRESYLVVMEEMGELTVWDVFLIDQDFAIERPTRYYRQGMHLFHLDSESANQEEEIMAGGQEKAKVEYEPPKRKRVASTVGTIKSAVSKILHPGHHHHATNGHGHHSRSANNLTVDDGHGHPRPSTDTRATSSSSSSSSSSGSSHPFTPMLDPSTNTNPLEPAQHAQEHEHREHEHHDGGDETKKKKKGSKDVSKHVFYVVNAQTRLKLTAKNERQMLQWITSLERAAKDSHYTGRNRFDSFAPIRLNVAAQWLVDGRDYFWNLSRAILLARETIQIHDWWLSPELQLRRPNMDKYRLDHLLEKKAKEGVKVYIILYQEVSNRTTPTDSHYAKQRLTALHPNIMVQRSPSHFQTGTFYWAHHEKLCVIDQAIAFMGGLDHCFGRWDTPQHVLVDDPEAESDGGDHIWPGKDYSNPRVSDFHTLNKPFDDMYDRSKIPRMPWHDVSMQVVGQPARDLARHFVQRWNHLLRIKNHTRAMPFLLPPPEFKPGELADMGLTGTCELQICRSAGPWSLGTPDRIEHSIQNAYLKAIQLSEHFVYIENQFFITSTVVNEVKVENRIGDAIVHRIIRAHRERTPWKCCIVIPLLPGFAFPVDHSDASAIRIILECQNRTICRGPHSIFGRLRKEGIDPDDYITVFSLRNWGKLRGDVLTTEQVYIHGKVCIVDDRLAIIGSANINERSQRGDRDSEIAAVIRDTDMIDCTMAGKPFRVGRFAHSLRVRLMREHLGVDVDALYEEDLMSSEPLQEPHEQNAWDPDMEQEFGKEAGVTRISKAHQHTSKGALMHDIIDGVEQALHGTGQVGAKDMSKVIRMAGIKSQGADNTAGDKFLREEREMSTHDGKKEPGFPSSVVPTLEEKTIMEHRPHQTSPIEEVPEDQDGSRTPTGNDRHQTGEARPSSEDARVQNGDAPKNQQENGSAMDNGDANRGPVVQDRSSDTNINGDIAQTEAADRTPPQAALETGELYGAPANAAANPREDNEVPHAGSSKVDAGSDEEKAPGARAMLRKHLAAKLGSKHWHLPTRTPHVDPYGFEDPICDAFWKDVWVASAAHNTEIFRKVFHAIPDDLVTTWKQYKEFVVHHERLIKPLKDHDPSDPPLARMPSEAADFDAPGQQRIAKQAANASEDELAREKEHLDGDGDSRTLHTPQPPESPSPVQGQSQKDKDKDKDKDKRQNKGPKPFDQSEREEMENLLRELRGHLVLYPNRFLEGEDVANNFLFPADRLLPLPIYD
ncbi:phospholipase D [Dichomitus squalens]|uniref:Phospholipase D1 n=1 Tax=Dichomitus squalens TaxID=114155 RepID=A0A4V6MWG9_9APHY|nr:phospholipase D [Dichomitus squalens]TBU61890.1 phospholipase D [Dichomitus squalens]